MAFRQRIGPLRQSAETRLKIRGGAYVYLDNAEIASERIHSMGEGSGHMLGSMSHWKCVWGGEAMLATVSGKGRGARTLVALILLVFLGTACETAGPKTAIGGATGAAAGGLIGHAAGGGTAGIVGGVLLGGLVGGAIGNALDQRDQQLAMQSAQNSFENSRTGTESAWRNPDSGNSGTITPTRTYESANGQYCREYQQTITVGGETQDAYGTACRESDGSWRIIDWFDFRAVRPLSPAVRSADKSGVKILLLTLIGLLCGGCFVLDEIDQGYAIMEAHSPKGKKSEPETETTSAAKNPDGTPMSARERLNDYYAKQRAKAPVAAKTAEAGDQVGRCVIRGATHYTRRSDCRLRGGKFL
jgi:surface antigen